MFGRRYHWAVTRRYFFILSLIVMFSTGVRSGEFGKDGAFPRAEPVARDRTACFDGISAGEPLREGYSFSVFRLFNPHPPIAAAKSPDGISPHAPSNEHQALLACVPEGAFDFGVLEAGLLREGSIRDLHPIGVFRVGGGKFLALYLHKDYETDDGEGVIIEVSGLLINGAGRAMDVLQGLSSWYEYEGSIRIRDFAYVAGSIVTSEQTYDPSVRDGVGNTLEYLDSTAMKVVEIYQIGGDPHL